MNITHGLETTCSTIIIQPVTPTKFFRRMAYINYGSLVFALYSTLFPNAISRGLAIISLTIAFVHIPFLRGFTRWVSIRGCLISFLSVIFVFPVVFVALL